MCIICGEAGRQTGRYGIMKLWRFKCLSRLAHTDTQRDRICKRPDQVERKDETHRERERESEMHTYIYIYIYAGMKPGPG